MDRCRAADHAYSSNTLRKGMIFKWFFLLIWGGMYLVKFLVHGEKIDQGSFKIRARNDGSLFQLLPSQGYYITS